MDLMKWKLELMMKAGVKTTGDVRAKVCPGW